MPENGPDGKQLHQSKVLFFGLYHWKRTFFKSSFYCISCLPYSAVAFLLNCIVICRYLTFLFFLDFPGGSDGKASVYNAGDLGSIPGSGRFPGEGNGNPLQYSCLENPTDGGAWCPWGRKESDTTEQLHFTLRFFRV